MRVVFQFACCSAIAVAVGVYLGQPIARAAPLGIATAVAVTFGGYLGERAT